MPQVGEVLDDVGGRHGRGRDTKMTADRFRDVAKRDALVADRVQDRASGCGLHAHSLEDRRERVRQRGAGVGPLHHGGLRFLS